MDTRLPRGARRAGAGAGAAGQRPPARRAAPRAADARAVPGRPAGRRAGRVPAAATRARRGPRHRPEQPVRDLEAAILRQDPALDPPPAITLSPPAGARPCRRSCRWRRRRSPAGQPSCAALDALLPGPARPPTAVVISAVSRHRRGRQDRPGRALGAPGRRPVPRRAAVRQPARLRPGRRGRWTPAEAVRGFLDALGVPPSGSRPAWTRRPALYRSLLAGRRMLVVLDNARDAEQVRPLLPGAPGCLVLVTSRNQLTGLVAAEGAHPLTLDLLTADEARELLARRLGAGPGRRRARGGRRDHRRVRPAAAGAGGRRRPRRRPAPASRSPPWPPSCATPRGAPGRARRRRPGHRRPGGVLLVLPGAEPRRRRGCSGCSACTPARTLAAPAAASLAGLPLRRARPLLAELTRAHLLTEHTPGRYTFHDLLRAYAAELAHTIDTDARPARRDRPDARPLPAHRPRRRPAAEPAPATRSSLAPPAARRHAREHSPTTSRRMAWFDRRAPRCCSAADRPGRRRPGSTPTPGSWPGPCDDLPATGGGTGTTRPPPSRPPLAAARRLADPPAQAIAHRGLGRAYARLGRHDDADTHLQRRPATCTPRPATTSARPTPTSTSATLLRAAGPPPTRRSATPSRPSTCSAPPATGPGRPAPSTRSAGTTPSSATTSRPSPHCQQALALQQELGDRDGEAATWDSLGYAHHHLGDHDQAIACYQHAARPVPRPRRPLQRGRHASPTSATPTTPPATPPPPATPGSSALTILDDLDHPDAGRIRDKLQAGQLA